MTASWSARLSSIGPGATPRCCGISPPPTAYPEATLSDAKLSLLNRAAIATCSRRGAGLAGDPFITDPMSCRFDPAELRCRGADSGQCLTAAEVATARAFYSGPRTRTGKAAFFGWLPGSEGPGRFGWSFLQSASNGQPQFGSLFKWVFGAQWDWRSFELDRDMPIVDAALGDDVNDATRGSLAAFRARGGNSSSITAWRTRWSPRPIGGLL